MALIYPFSVHNREVFRTAAGSNVTGTVSWKNESQKKNLPFIIAENSRSVKKFKDEIVHPSLSSTPRKPRAYKSNFKNSESSNTFLFLAKRFISNSTYNHIIMTRECSIYDRLITKGKYCYT